MRKVFRTSLVQAAGLCSIALCSFALLIAAPQASLDAQTAKPQTPAPPAQEQVVPPDQIHPITGLPLPPDDPNYVPPPPAPKPLTKAEKLAAARKAATVAANARIAAAKEAVAKKAADKAAAEKAAAEKAAADREAARAASAEKAEADKKAAAEKAEAEKAAAAEKAEAAKKAAADKAEAAKAAADKAAADRAAAKAAAAEKAEAAKKAAADKLAAEKAAAAEKAEAAKAAADKAAADRAAARKAAADKLAADKAAAAEKAAAAKAAADEKAEATRAAAAEKAAADEAAAADRAAAAKATADKAAAEKAVADKAAAEKLAADKAAAAEKAEAARAAAADRAAAAKAAADKAAADKLAAKKAAADKLAADRAAAAATAAEKADAAKKAAAEKALAEKAAADKAAADKASADKLATDRAAAAKAAADKAAADRIAAEKAAADEKAAAEKRIAARSSHVPTPTVVTMPTAVVPPDTTAPTQPAPTKPAAVTMPTTRATVESPVTVAKPVAPSVKSSVVQPAPAAPPPPGKPAPAAPAPAAAPAPTSGVAAIVFLGAEPYTPAELTPITGLTLGSTPNSSSIQQASQRLIDTGLFSNVAASYDLNGALGTATFTLKPAAPDQLVRASFANFVWLTPTELNTALKSVPFYHGLVPLNGTLTMTRDIENTLAAELKAKGVTATITHSLVPPSQFHPYTAMEFRVTDPDTILETAQVFDVPPTLVNKMLKAQDDAVKMPYNEGIAGTTLTDVLLGPVREAGYLGARLTRVEKKRKVIPSAIYVDYTARLDAGPIYSVRSLNWTPSAIYTAADFKRDAALHIGQRPTPDGAAKTEAAILASYRAQGYLEATVSSSYKLAPETGAIDYTFTATAGPQYHLRSLTVHGLNAQAKKDFDGAWTIQPGDIYNEDYLLNFLNAHSNIASLAGYTFDYNRTTTPDTHEVDLTLNFKPAK